jgi:hypothetical protein
MAITIPLTLLVPTNGYPDGQCADERGEERADADAFRSRAQQAAQATSYSCDRESNWAIEQHHPLKLCGL